MSNYWGGLTGRKWQQFSKYTTWFSEFMRVQMVWNRWKKHWTDCTYSDLQSSMRAKQDELDHAINEFNTYHNPALRARKARMIIRHSADIANYGMMIADKTRREVHTMNRSRKLDLTGICEPVK
jgi:hypothetical protein